MNHAYVGIVTPRGLELYYPEGEHTARFLIRRLRRSGLGYCVWFVLDAHLAHVVGDLIRHGHPDGAWGFVQDAAVDYGTVLPDGDDSTWRDDAA